MQGRGGGTMRAFIHRALLGATIAAVLGPALAAAAEAPRGHDAFQQQCALCHGEEGGGGRGPSLVGVLGRQAGTGVFGYSRALRQAGFVWDEPRLAAYIANPARAVPGTTMAAAVDQAADRADIIAYLATLRPQPAAARTGPSAMADWHEDAPGVRRRITLSDLPPAYATPSAGNSPRIVDRPPAAVPHAPPGFTVALFAQGFDNPRVLRTAPNGDIFVAETATGRIRVLRGTTQATVNELFAQGLDGPFGIAFYPPGPNPEWVYVAELNAIRRFPYRPGDLHARGRPEPVVPRLAATTGGHTTRDLVFAPDGSRMFVSVGSASNVAQAMGRPPDDLPAWERQHALGAAWGPETNRADVLSFRPDGSDPRLFATGLRNCVGLAVQRSGQLWCSTNERDGLGDDLVPDYVTRVRQGEFYGWPWYYLGDHEEPRLAGQRPDLRGHVSLPDVLLQSHSASLGMVFQDSPAVPPAFHGAFAAEHGSWNRARRTGYKVIRVILDAQGAPTGEYEDFLTGFVLNDQAVWGRPVGITVAADGALLVSEDAGNTIWRVSWTGQAR